MPILVEITRRIYRDTVFASLEITPIVQEIYQSTGRVFPLIRVVLQASDYHHKDGVGAKAPSENVSKTPLIEHGFDYGIHLPDVWVFCHVALHIHSLPRSIIR